MSHCVIQQKSNFSSFGNGDLVVCPKPVRPLRWQMCYQQEPYESKSGPELLDIILSKSGGYDSRDATCIPIASSPPFFSGSPPSRVSNPLIQDARFGDGKMSLVSPQSIIPNPASGMPSSSPSSSPRKGGYIRPNYGNKPAVRVEGFDCLDRDTRRSCRIPALG